jgi:hypothetical protein
MIAYVGGIVKWAAVERACPTPLARRPAHAAGGIPARCARGGFAISRNPVGMALLHFLLPCGKLPAHCRGSSGALVHEAHLRAELFWGMERLD